MNHPRNHIAAQLAAALLLGCATQTAPAPVAPSQSPSQVEEAQVEEAQVEETEPPAETREEWGGLRVLEEGSGNAALVFLHGYGANADRTMPLVRRLAGPRLRVVVPDAPLAIPPGRGWFNLQGVRITGDISQAEPPGLEAASASVNAVFQTLEERGLRRECIVIAGFSQGAVVAMDAAVRHPPVAGVGVFSGALIAKDRWSNSWSDLRVFLSHGRRDSQLPFRYGNELHEALAASRVRQQFVAFDGDHTIPPEVFSNFVATTRSWLSNCR
ncbi:MAG: alpha/beta fold hydrolase [Myxococcota bacterium]